MSKITRAQRESLYNLFVHDVAKREPGKALLGCKSSLFDNYEEEEIGCSLLIYVPTANDKYENFMVIKSSEGISLVNFHYEGAYWFWKRDSKNNTWSDIETTSDVNMSDVIKVIKNLKPLFL